MNEFVVTICWDFPPLRFLYITVHIHKRKRVHPPPAPRHPRCVKLRPETPQQPNAPRASHSFYTSRSRNTLFTVKAPPTHMPPNTREYPHCRQRLVCSIQVVAAPVFACPLIRRRHTRTPRHYPSSFHPPPHPPPHSPALHVHSFSRHTSSMSPCVVVCMWALSPRGRRHPR